MCFNKAALALISILLGISLSACGWKPGSSFKWGEDNPPTSSVRINLERFACLRDIDKKVNEYLNAKMTIRQVNELSGCLRSAITQFKANTKDLKNGGYLPERLAKFLNDEYFSGQKKVTPEYLFEIMQLKRVVLGGREDIITAQELDGVVQIINLVETQVIRNLPYIPLYRQLNIEGVNDVSRSDLKAARQQLLSSAKAVADLFQSRNQLYSLDSLGRFIQHTKAFLNWSVFHENSFTHEQLSDLMLTYKEMVTGNRESVLKPTEWQNVFASAASLYGLYLNYKIKFHKIDFKYGPSYEVFFDTVNEAFDLIGRWIEATPKHIITYEATDRLFRSLERAGLLPLNLTQGSVSLVYRQLISQGLRPLSESRGISLGLGAPQLGELKSEFYIWANTQTEINGSIQRALKINFSDLENISGDTSKKVSVLDLTRIFNLAPFQVDFGMREMSDLIESVRPMFKVNDRRAYIMPLDELPASGVFNNIQNVSYLNTMRSIVRILIRSFATDVNILNMAGITERDLIELYKTIKPMGIELKFIDSRKLDAGRSNFAEANMFTFSGDGIASQRNSEKDLLTFNETIEFMAELWSGGSIRDTLYKNSLLKCRSEGVTDGPVDEFGVNKVDRQCFARHIYDNQMIEFSNLPYMMRFVQSLKEDERVELFENLQDIAKIPCESSKYIENSEVATISTALHYIEVIFTVYDTNKDGILDSREIMKSFSRFYGYFDRAIFEDRGKVYDISFVKAIFALMVKNQKLPGYLDSAQLVWYKYKYFDNNLDQTYTELPEIMINRSGLIRVLKVLSDVSKNPQIKSCAAKPDPSIFRYNFGAWAP